MSIYLERYAFTPLHIDSKPQLDTGLIVVIPVFNEKHLNDALNSLIASSLPPVTTEVIIIINQAENCSDEIELQNNITFKDTSRWINNNNKKEIHFFVKHLSLPKKHAGVGLARKAGMDEATRRFEAIDNEKGIILCYDADCFCAPNYLSEIYHSFTSKKLKGASIYFEHQIDNLSSLEKEGILQYELHLRHYVNGLRKAGYPYAFHTVGSSMAVRVDIYKKVGGMNRRKAGEDFHFLHKVIPFGNFEEITSTAVYPSSRSSNRVPFGTGKAMGDWINHSKSTFYSYHPAIFNDIAGLLKTVPLLYKLTNINEITTTLTPEIQAYLELENFTTIVVDIKRQSSNLNTFIHRWFSWFNGLKVLHLVHYLRDNKYESMPICTAVKTSIKEKEDTTLQLLEKYRNLDKNFTADQIDLKHLYSEHL